MFLKATKRRRRTYSQWQSILSRIIGTNERNPDKINNDTKNPSYYDKPSKIKNNTREKTKGR